MNESGKMTLSAEEWEISRSCQRGMFSRATSRFPRRIRERPEIRSAPHGIFLVRHRGGAFLALGERLLELEHLGLLEVADLGRELVQAGAEQGQRRDDLGVPVALQDLGRYPGGGEAQFVQRGHFHPRVEVDVGSDRARDAADTDRLQGPPQPLLVALHLLVPDENFDAEGDRLGVDAVGPAHHHRLFVLPGFFPEDGRQGARRLSRLFPGTP